MAIPADVASGGGIPHPSIQGSDMGYPQITSESVFVWVSHWHGVPFARQRRPIVGVLRMCWLLPGSFDCFCCPRASVHRPSIACLAVFLCE